MLVGICLESKDGHSPPPLTLLTPDVQGLTQVTAVDAEGRNFLSTVVCASPALPVPSLIVLTYFRAPETCGSSLPGSLILYKQLAMMNKALNSSS